MDILLYLGYGLDSSEVINDDHPVYGEDEEQDVFSNEGENVFFLHCIN
jgi:hypothetical protein